MGAFEPEPRASSSEPRAASLFLQASKDPRQKNPKTDIMPLYDIYYMWGCFTMPNYTRERWNEVSRSNRASPKRNRTLTIFSFLFRIPSVRETDRFIKNRAANFGRTGSIEGDPECSGRKKLKLAFRFVSDRNFRNLLVHGKHLWSSSVGALRHGK